MGVSQEPPLLLIDDLSVEAPFGKILRGLHLRQERAEVLGLVGESGCGKTMTGRALMGLLPPGWRASGQALLEGESLLARSDSGRSERMGMVFQEPGSAFNPYLSVGRQVGEALGPGDNEARVLELLASAGITEPRRVAEAFPHQLSGGLKQRALLAAALAGEPRLLIADEPTTALDATVGARLLETLVELARRKDMALLLITHDLAAARAYCDRICVMYAGQIVEAGPADRVFSSPWHPYSKALASGASQGLLKGSAPSRGLLPEGCSFHPRCSQAQPLCGKQVPGLTVKELGLFRCHFPLEGSA